MKLETLAVSLVAAITFAGPVLAQDDTRCNAILRDGVFNQTTTDSRKSVQDNLLEWLKTTEWEQFKKTQSSGLNIGFPIKGVPVTLSGNHSQESFREWKREVDQGRYREFSSEEFLTIVQRSVSTELVSAWLECVKSTGLGLSCSSAVNGDTAITFTFKWTPNSMTDYPPVVQPFGLQVVGARAPSAFGPGSEIPIGGASIILTRESPTSAVTIVLNTSKGSCQRTLPGKLSTPIDDLPVLKLRSFQATSERAGHPEVRLSVPPGFKVISGGCRANFTGGGNMLTASYPESERTWLCKSKDHSYSDPSTLDAFVTAIEDPLDEWLVHIGSATSQPSAVPVASAQLPSPFVLSGGGAVVHYRSAGQLLTGSMPDGTRAWTAKAKQHTVDDSAAITAYVIGIRPRSGGTMPQAVVFQQRSQASGHNSVASDVEVGFTRLGCGAFADWRTHGSLLTAVYASADRRCEAKSKDHAFSESAPLTAYAIGIKFEPKVCDFRMGPDRFSFGPSGGSGNINVSTANGCEYTATTGDYWIRIEPSGKVNGNSDVSVRVAANTSGQMRTGSISIAGRSISVTQEGAAVCSPFEVRLGRQSFEAVGGSAIAEISGVSGCAWTAQTTANFVTFRPASGQGSGQTEVVLAANPGSASRTATLNIAGRTITITQQGSANCAAFSVRLSQTTFEAGGGSAIANITGQPACPWTAKSTTDFVTFRPASGEGPGQIEIVVAGNTATSARTAILTIAGISINISQAGTAVTTNPTPGTLDPDAGPLAGTSHQVRWLYLMTPSGYWYIVRPTLSTTTPGVSGSPAVLLLKGIDVAANNVAWKPIQNFAASGDFPAVGTVFSSVTIAPDATTIEFGTLANPTSDPELTQLAGGRFAVRWLYLSADQDRKWYIVGNDRSASAATGPPVLMLKAVDPKVEGSVVWKPIHNAPAFGGSPAIGRRFQSVAIAPDGRTINVGAIVIGQ